MTRPAPKWRPGDTVVVLPDLNKMGGGTFTVSSVGRKWLTVGTRRVRRFDIATGREQGNGAGGSCYAVTPQEAADLRARAQATKRLRDLTATWDWHRVLSVHEMDMISGVIERAKERVALK